MSDDFFNLVMGVLFLIVGVVALISHCQGKGGRGR